MNEEDEVAESESLVRARELGNAISTAMTRAGLTIREVAEALDWPHAKLVRFLAGRGEVDQIELIPLLALCLIDGADREYLLFLNRVVPRPGWLPLTAQRAVLVDHEVRARAITQFSPDLVPDLLRTPDYARAVLDDGADFLPDVAARFDSLIRRQHVLNLADRPRRFTFFVHERVCRAGIGTPRLLSDQLCHLMRMSTRPGIVLRVIPAAHADTGKGSCALLEFADADPVVHLERLVRGAFLSGEQDVSTYRDMFAVLAGTALDEGQSRELIANRVVELYEDRE
jgi:hypothetical protein